jgi:hypothetical protein
VTDAMGIPQCGACQRRQAWMNHTLGELPSATGFIGATLAVGVVTLGVYGATRSRSSDYTPTLILPIIIGLGMWSSWYISRELKRQQPT